MADSDVIVGRLPVLNGLPDVPEGVVALNHVLRDGKEPDDDTNRFNNYL